MRRLKPDPIPPLNPEPEHAAGALKRALYEDVKAVLQAPWMGVVAMAFAHYPTFWRVLWDGVRPLAGSAFFVAECDALRTEAEAGVVALAPPPMEDRLRAMGYGPAELAEIRRVLQAFSHGNMGYLLLATLARRALEGAELGPLVDSAPPAGRHGPAAGGALVLMEPHHAGAATRAVFDDVKATLGLPFLNTDYRAMARWPSYFSAAWGDLRPHVRGRAHTSLVEQTHRRAAQAAQSLPNPGGLSPQALMDAAAADADPAEILAVVRLFQWVLPELIVNVAFFNHQMKKVG